VQEADVYFRPLEEGLIEELIEEGTVFWCAGGLMVEHPKVEPFIERIDGEFAAVLGLSKKLTAELIRKALEFSAE